MIRWTLAIVLLFLLAAVGVVWADPVEVVPDGRFQITVNEQLISVPYISNRSIDSTHVERTRAVISVPGGSRDIETVGDWMQQGAFQAGVLPTALLVGMQFLLEIDVLEHHLSTDVAYWTHLGWYDGDLSDSTGHNPRTARASSYAFMDSLVYQLATLNPQLEAIVVAGPSAGGKYVQRYAALTHMDEQLIEEGLPPLMFVTINNGNFVYPGPERRCVDGDFAVPDDVLRGFIPRFNDYPYGLDSLNEYGLASGVQHIANRYGSKFIFYIVGELDNGVNADDQPMALEGWNNIQRNTFFFEYVMFKYGPVDTQGLIVIEGADHNTHEIILDPAAWEPLFYFVPDPAGVPEGGGDGGEGSSLPRESALQVYPNPFNPGTTLTVAMQRPGVLKLEVFNVAGRRVAILQNGAVAAGRHAFTWDAGDMASGVYFVHATALGQISQVEKVTLLK